MMYVSGKLEEAKSWKGEFNNALKTQPMQNWLQYGKYMSQIFFCKLLSLEYKLRKEIDTSQSLFNIDLSEMQ